MPGKHARRCLMAKEMRAKGMQRSSKRVRNSGEFQRRIEQAELWPQSAKQNVAHQVCNRTEKAPWCEKWYASLFRASEIKFSWKTFCHRYAGCTQAC